MNCHNELNEYTSKAISTYNTWRSDLDLISNYLMETFNNWQIYITEHDKDIICLHFCSRIERMNDTSFLLTKEQFLHLKHTLDCSIIPAIVSIEEQFFGCDCECQ